MSDEAAGDTDSDRFSASVDHIRSVSKWTLAAYAAVGGILVAGSQLSSLGAFELEDPRLWVAIGAIVLALGSVAYAVYVVLSVELAGAVTLQMRARDEEKISHPNDAVHPLCVENPALLAGYRNVRALRADYLNFITLSYDATRLGNDPKSAERYAKWVDYLGKVVDRLLRAARYDAVDKSFSPSQRGQLMSVSLVAAFAVGLFAWAANPKELPKAPAPFLMPVEANLVLSSGRQEELVELLGGESCVGNQVDIVVLSITEGNADVITLPRQDCEVKRLTVDQEEISASEDVNVLETPSAEN
ncbi:MAG: hypothetical protein M3464_19405 [Chloroflexota bacterium]|nr:hypothetical protein [Chloroflexota bacterium]